MGLSYPNSAIQGVFSGYTHIHRFYYCNYLKRIYMYLDGDKRDKQVSKWQEASLRLVNGILLSVQKNGYT